MRQAIGRKIIEDGQFFPFVEARDVEYDVVRKYVRGGKPARQPSRS